MQMNIRTWIAKFEAGDFSSPDRDTQIEAGWYDWFCKDSKLAEKTTKLGSKLIMIKDSKKFDIDKSYVFFKNNCPVVGSLYDDFRISDLETHDVIYSITPKGGLTSKNGKGEVWGKENGFKWPLFVGTWKEIKDWFNK